MNTVRLILIVPLFGCVQEHGAQTHGAPTWTGCTEVSAAFAGHVRAVLTDSTDLFRGAYPPAAPLTCELLEGLQHALENDSARYWFGRLSRKYWSEDPGCTATFAYAERHRDFHVILATIAHWNEDHRIRGLHALQDYRRMRPLVCTTAEGRMRLEEQDRQAVCYLLQVLEHTPHHISGSENATIHAVYLGEVCATLDLFTGQRHGPSPDRHPYSDLDEAAVAQAMDDWRRWLER